MNTQSNFAAAPTPHAPLPAATPTPDAPPAPAIPPKIRQVHDHIYPTDLLPPDARPFHPSDKKSRRSAAAKSIEDLAPGTSFRTLRLADVRPRRVDWLWPGRIPIGKVTLLIGDPGVGKSLLALDLAARLTRGTQLPDARYPDPETPNPTPDLPPSTRPLPPSSVPPAPCSVLLLSAEDDLADTIRPRLEALGADCSRIVTVTTSDAADSTLALPHFDLLIPLLERALDSAPDCRLVIIDPITAYLGRAIENFNAEVRRIMSAFSQLAARRRLAILAISHLRKQQGAAMHRSMGSLAFVAAARATWLITKDHEHPARRLLLPLKNNFGTDTTGLAFTILPLPLGEGRGEGVLEEIKNDGQPIITWSPEPIEIAADAALAQMKRNLGRPSDERDEATRWLRVQLAAGVRPSAEIEAVATANGFKLPTLRRAFRDLGGEAVRVGFGPLGEWFWRLPGIGDQKPQATFANLWPDLQNYTTRPEC
jgi:putative DNA primase/helicase